MFDEDGSGNMDRVEIVQVDDQRKRESRERGLHPSLFIKYVAWGCLEAGNECAWFDESAGTRTRTSSRTHTHVHACKHMRAYTHTHTHTHTHPFTNMHTHLTTRPLRWGKLHTPTP